MERDMPSASQSELRSQNSRGLWSHLLPTLARGARHSVLAVHARRALLPLEATRTLGPHQTLLALRSRWARTAGVSLGTDGPSGATATTRSAESL